MDDQSNSNTARVGPIPVGTFRVPHLQLPDSDRRTENDRSRCAFSHEKAAARRIRRLLKIAQYLQSGTDLSINELTHLVGVSRRKLFRDLKILAEEGFHFVFDRRSGAYKASAASTSLIGCITYVEVDAIVLGLEWFCQSGAGTRPETVASARAKFLAAVPVPMRQRWERLNGKLENQTGAPPEACTRDVFDALFSCLGMKLIIEVEYSVPSGELEKKTFSPIALAYLDNTWHLPVADANISSLDHGRNAISQDTLPGGISFDLLPENSHSIPLNSIIRYSIIVLRQQEVRS